MGGLKKWRGIPNGFVASEGFQQGTKLFVEKPAHFNLRSFQPIETVSRKFEPLDLIFLQSSLKWWLDCSTRFSPLKLCIWPWQNLIFIITALCSLVICFVILLTVWVLDRSLFCASGKGTDMATMRGWKNIGELNFSRKRAYMPRVLKDKLAWLILDVCYVSQCLWVGGGRVAQFVFPLSVLPLQPTPPEPPRHTCVIVCCRP